MLTDQSGGGRGGRHELALLYRRMGDAPHCKQVLAALAAEQPDYLPAQADRVETLWELGRPDEARRLLARLPERDGLREEIVRLRELVG